MAKDYEFREFDPIARESEASFRLLILLLAVLAGAVIGHVLEVW